MAQHSEKGDFVHLTDQGAFRDKVANTHDFAAVPAHVDAECSGMPTPLVASLTDIEERLAMVQSMEESNRRPVLRWVVGTIAVGATVLGIAVDALM